jgi:hypothetical protein
LHSVKGLRAFTRRADAADGAADGLWYGVRIDRLDWGFDTPGGARYESKVVEKLIRREGFGLDAVPDLLFVDYGLPQDVARRFGMGSLPMRDTVRVMDRELFRLWSFLSGRVGRKRTVLVLTADHGATPEPQVMDSYVIDPRELRADLERRFGGQGQPPIVDGLSPTEIWLNKRSLGAGGYTAYDVSRFLLDYTVGANEGTGAHADRRMFLTAFPTNLEPGTSRRPFTPDCAAPPT